MAEKVHAMHGRDHRPSKYGDATLTGAAADPVQGMLFLPSATETDGHVITRDSTQTYGLKWAAASVTQQGYSSVINLPVLGLQSNVNNYEGSGAATIAIDSGYPHNGYFRHTADTNYICWPVNIGPQGSWWMAVVLFANGPDFGKVDLQIATAADATNIYGLSLGGGIAARALSTFVTLQNRDCYAAVLDKFPSNSQVFKQFLITGTDRATGTAFTGSNTDRWDGGSGPHYLQLKTNGKNASSSGFKIDISEVILMRLSNDLTL